MFLTTSIEMKEGKPLNSQLFFATSVTQKLVPELFCIEQMVKISPTTLQRRYS